MYVLHHEGKPRVAVILPPKTGTRSLEHALVGMGATRHRGRHAIVPEELGKADVVVSSIRHPCDVLVSWYHYASYGHKSHREFRDFWDYIIRQHPIYLKRTALRHADLASEYIRFEDGLTTSFNAMLERHGYDKTALPRIGVAKNRAGWRSYYSPVMLTDVYNRYKADFDRYGYTV